VGGGATFGTPARQRSVRALRNKSAFLVADHYHASARQPPGATKRCVRVRERTAHSPAQGMSGKVTSKLSRNLLPVTGSTSMCSTFSCGVQQQRRRRWANAAAGPSASSRSDDGRSYPTAHKKELAAIPRIRQPSAPVTHRCPVRLQLRPEQRRSQQQRDDRDCKRSAQAYGRGRMKGERTVQSSRTGSEAVTTG
jgi:hypothetical protein